jgi:hypothetical protein
MVDPTARSSDGRIKYYESEEPCWQMVEQAIAPGIPERNVLPALKAAHG